MTHRLLEYAGAATLGGKRGSAQVFHIRAGSEKERQGWVNSLQLAKVQIDRERSKERERECVCCVCVCVRERERVCVCVCV